MSDTKSYSQFRPHPWHGLSYGDEDLETLQVYVEITANDGMKYEIDKQSGYLVVDRPFRLTSQMPCIYGFVPRTLCGEKVTNLCPDADTPDLDPLDICVISDLPIANADILLRAKVVGGLQMIDGGEADDKIIAVLEGDRVFGDAKDISDIPQSYIERIQHYFLTYKLVPGAANKVVVDTVYDKEHALKVIAASIEDYNDKYGQS